MCISKYLHVYVCIFLYLHIYACMYLRCPPDGGRYVGGRYGWPVDRRWRRGTSATTVNWRPGTTFPIPVPRAV